MFRTFIKFFRRFQAWLTVNYRLPHILLIQAGMGAGVSNWSLANITARFWRVIGTVSGVVAHDLMIRTLQRGDPGGHFRRALRHFPLKKTGVAKRIIAKYYVEGGIPPGQKFRGYPAFDLDPSQELQEIMVVGMFCLVWLAKRGHFGLISVNLLEKMQITHIYYLVGAMLAGVDVVTMGAGIIDQIPGVLDDIAADHAPSYKVKVVGSKNGHIVISFDPEKLFGEKLPVMKRPAVLAIVSGKLLANMLLEVGVEGFVVEGPIAGGHNAPPRGGNKKFDDRGQPIYGKRDEVDFADFRSLRNKKTGKSIPFWLAGGFGSPEGLQKALSEGATGIQVGSMFALCDNSGLLEWLRREARRLGYNGLLEVLTTMRSPTGYPFKVAQVPGTLSDDELFNKRTRSCSICALRVPYEVDGEIGYRCSAEPISNFEKKGGKRVDAEFILCLCNALLATIGLGNFGEIPILTMGDDVSFLPFLMKNEDDGYTADDVIVYLLPTFGNKMRRFLNKMMRTFLRKKTDTSH